MLSSNTVSEVMKLNARVLLVVAILCDTYTHTHTHKVEWINVKRNLGWACEWRIVWYQFCSLSDYWDSLLLNKAVNTKENSNPWKPHRSNFPFPCSLCHHLPQRLCITWCDYPHLLVSWGWSHSSDSSWPLRTQRRGRWCWAEQLSLHKEISFKYAGSSMETSLVTWLHHHRHVPSAVFGGCLLPTCLRQEWNVCVKVARHLLRAEIPQNCWREVSHLYWNLIRVIVLLLFSKLRIT